MRMDLRKARIVVYLNFVRFSDKLMEFPDKACHNMIIERDLLENCITSKHQNMLMKSRSCSE